MKRSYMLAILAATSVLGASANAQTSTSAPEQASMFVIATPAPGVVDFKGTGSATFTNTQSATESVTVGSNSSFGVTVSGANTSDYTSTAAAALKLDETTSLNHATGTASKPNYLAASYFLGLFNRVDTEEVNKNIGKHYNAIYGLVCKSRELNTLGHVYLSAGKINEAILVFYLNTYLFRYEPNVYLNYGIALQANDELERKETSVKHWN